MPAALATRKHCWPAGQSRETMQAEWHLPKLHDSGSVQSLFNEQGPPTSRPFLLLPQETMKDVAIAKQNTADRAGRRIIKILP